MYRLLTKVSVRQGIKVRFVESWDIAKVKSAISPNTKIVHIETPSNPLMHVTDIRALAEALKGTGVLLTVDNTILTPYLMRPLELGADIVIHSATKFFAGHADTMAGFVCTKSPEHSKVMAFHQNAEGTALSPFDCFLVLRGIKTLAVRIDRAQTGALRVAELLARHPGVRRVHYAGLPPPPGGADPARAEAFRIQRAQARGAGVLLSFETGCAKASERFVNALRIFKITVSFGGCGRRAARARRAAAAAAASTAGVHTAQIVFDCTMTVFDHI
jgi:cysteine-S-conjugate beta-lyase